MNQEHGHSFVAELGSVREPVDLSLVEVMTNAERILVEQGYKISQRTDSMVVGERRERSSLFRSVVVYSAVAVKPRPEGGVWITLKGNDREGVRKRQAEWRRWAENLPKVETANEGDKPEEELSRLKKRRPKSKAAQRRGGNSQDRKTDTQGKDQPHIEEVNPSAPQVEEEIDSDSGAWATATPWERNPRVAPGKSSADIDAAEKRYDKDIVHPPDPEQDHSGSDAEEPKTSNHDKVDVGNSDGESYEKEGAEMAKDLTDLIERVEAFEERLGVRLEGLFAKADEYEIRVNGEVHARNGNKLSKDITIVVTAHDTAGRVIGVQGRSVFADDFFGFEAFTRSLEHVEDIQPAKIRVYPEVR